jgi:capsular exopolysaccharide synthesis family protein
MHGQALALTPHGDRSTRLVEAPLALSYGDYQFEEPARGIDLHALWLIMVRNRVLMLGILLLALAAGVASIWFTKPVYSAQATIQIDPQAPRILGTENITPDAGRTENDRVLQTQVDLLASRSTAQNVANKLHLASDPQFLRETGLDDEPAGLMRSAKVTTALQQRLSLSSPRDTRIIAVRYNSQDPVAAARTANTFAETFINDSLNRRLDTYSYSRRFLQGQLEGTKGRLEQSERDLVNYARAAGLVDAGNAAGVAGSDGERRSITAASLVDLNAAYSQAQANRMQAQQRWQQAMSTPAMSLPDVLGNPAIQNLTRQRAELEATLQQERQRRQDDHPAIIQAKAQIAELNKQIGTIAAGVRASIGNQYRVAAGQEAALRGNVNALKSATFAEQSKGIRYNILKREADTNRSLYNTLLQRYHEVSTQAANTTNPISIIDRAQTPSLPAYPRPAVNMALATLAGVVLALGAGIARNRMDDEVHGPADLERDFGVPLLGVVPLPEKGEDFALALADPLSRVTEAHHAISLALDPIARTADHSVLLVTSSGPNEGKSMIAFKLAANFAAAGKKVLMIDADMRRGSLHRILGLSNRVGLADLLAKDSSQELSHVVQHCEDRGFSIVPRGLPGANPAELLASRRFAELLDESINLYDVVILDGPPVLGLADAPRLSGMADATVFVVEANRTSREHTKIAMRRLAQAGAGQIGMVISKYDSAKDFGASDYAYSYVYGADEAKDFTPLYPPRPAKPDRQVEMAV